MKAFLKFFKHRRGQQRAENRKNCNAKCSTLVLASKYQNSDERQTLRNLAKLHFFQVLFPSVSRQGGCNNLFLRNSEKDQRTNKSNAELLPIFVFSTIA